MKIQNTRSRFAISGGVVADEQVSALYEEVKNQIESGEFPFVSEVFYSLQKKGCNRKQARTVILQVYAGEKHRAAEEGRELDAKQYESALRTKNRTVADAGEVRDVRLEIEDELNATFEEISDRQMEEGYEYCAEKLLEIWPRTKEYIISNLYRDTSAGVEKPELDELQKMTEYNVTFGFYLPDMAMILGNAYRYEEEIAYCRDVLELFSWERSEPDEYKDDIGMALKEAEGRDAAVKWYEDWLAEEPDNGNCINAYGFLLQMDGDVEEALRLVEAHLPESEPTDIKYQNLYLRAGELYEEIGDTAKAEHYRKLEQACLGKDPFSGIFFGDNDADEWKQKPVVKEKKIYPNDPCPCGSGKKYKKCCGKAGR